MLEITSADEKSDTTHRLTESNTADVHAVQYRMALTGAHHYSSMNVLMAGTFWYGRILLIGYGRPSLFWIRSFIFYFYSERSDFHLPLCVQNQGDQQLSSMHSKSDVKTENEGMKLFLQTRYRFRCCSSSVFIVAVIIFHASRTPKEIYGFSFSSSLIKPTLYTTSSYGLIPLQQPKEGIFGGSGSRTANRNLYSVHKTCITGLVPTPTRLDISRTDATSHMVNNTSATTSSGTNRVASENGLSDLRQASIGKKTVATPTNDPEWRFFDTARIHVSGGMGGNGAVAFRREKGDALGGPCGGKGGFGGSVYLICDESINTLAPLRQSVHIRAEKGHNGIGKGKDGAQGESIYVRVPPGTIVRDMLTQKVAGELKVGGEQLLVARGGRGGRGNAAFKTPRLTAPKLAEKGEPGAARWLTVELRLVADVGFLGKPVRES